MERPKLSVIIASVNGYHCIEECLTALEKQPEIDQSEILVLDRCQDGTAEAIRKRFPFAKVQSYPPTCSIPELRRIGVAEAAGEIIVITEDHCIAPDNWFAEISKAHARGYGAVGGAVENGSCDSIVDWAVFFCEYTQCMRPLPEGIVDDIPGNNASYQRWALDKCKDVLAQGVWESFLHAKLKERGVALVSVPAIVVYHKKSFGVGEFLSQRYHYGRSFAGMRVADASPSRRWYYVMFAPLLPLLLLPRMARRILQKKRCRKQFLLALPLLVLFTISWAAGEFIGYLCGPGASLAKVE